MSYNVIDSFFKWKPPIFVLDSDSTFNGLNVSIKILLPYIRKFLRKKNIAGRVFNLDYVSIKNPASRTEKSHFSYVVAQITIVLHIINNKYCC
jgi:hypothetical protein